MPAQPQTSARTDLEIDRATHTIRMTRVFDAPRADIFEAWTKPEHVTCWWDAAGEPLTICEIDLRPGGAFKFVTRGRPEMAFAGAYHEIAPPERLVFEAIGAMGRVLLQDVAGQTHMTVEIECRSAEQLEQYLKMGVDTGTSQTLDNLVSYVRSRSSAMI
ncbi:MAG: SRPBCC domain-containing protein [Sphingomonas sp.]